MSSDDFRLLVGLGNPGSKYRLTRHNVGFMALEKLAEKESAKFKLNKKLFGEVAEFGIGDDRKRLLMPDTFMNQSGRSVQAAMNWFNIEISQVLIISDDIDLPLGKLRIRRQGSSGGHNGLKSIINCLGTSAFYRLKIGIGNYHSTTQKNQSNTISYVLGDFDQKEKLIIENVLNEALAGLSLIKNSGIEKAVTYLNSIKPEPYEKKLDA
ncbi:MULTISPECIES: aminoacyl-tRNA hydrolase [Prochlorococcus]|uniref:aminoacyl-tRNA hydrolase n=1 Tax=Prochlorococcus TaxID=1218 RepID=UPI0005338BC3|nr:MULTISPECIES: aminoacyl-tRNA hydrolase [Prochlorococcus]KGG13115.1 Peptidyl-tRNA hydrolase [Prochlorococcus sp. MIT 0601]